VVKALVRYFSYLFHGLLAVFLVAVSSFALASGPERLRLEMLPWKGATLTYVVFFGALFGIASIVLAILGKLRPLFLLWSVLVAVLMIKGFVFSPYYFGRGQLSTAIFLMLAALISLMGAWFQMRSCSPSWKKKY
jgi:hypothetical protein